MGEPIVLGIDASASKVAFVGMFGDDFFVRDYKKLGKSGAEACSAARAKTLMAWVEAKKRWPGHPIAAFIESPIVGRGGIRSTIVQAYTSGSVQGTLYGLEVPVGLVNVSSWKKHVVGNGRASKSEVASFVELRWPSIHEEAAGSQDVADAACIAYYGILSHRGLG